MSQTPLASIIISSYNYERYLEEAVDSSLAQTYPDTEVIVVDDGSTDNSREIVAGYGSRIIGVLKENGGQASALNAGVRASRGRVLFFLDSDDVLLPTAVEKAVRFFENPEVVKVHWPLLTLDEHGDRTDVMRGAELPAGDLRDAVIRDGPYGYAWPDTTGNAWARRFVERVFPMPEADYRTCPDLYLAALAPLFGSIQRIAEPQALYRDHGANSSGRASFEERVRIGLRREDHCLTMLAEQCRARGIGVDRARWEANCWWHQIDRATREIRELIPAGETFILVDEAHWGMDADFAGRRRLPFLEWNGQYWGEPADDQAAIRELHRLRGAGATFMVFGWPYLWWLDHYAEFHHHLRSEFQCLRKNDALVVFDLRA